MSTVARLLTVVDVAGEGEQSARHEAVLVDGRRVLLLDDRGWSTTAPESLEEMERTARMVVGPDEPSGGHTPADMATSHWESLAERLRRQGVEADASSLARLPHDVELASRARARCLGIELRPWEAADRVRVQELLKLLGPDAEVRADEAPTYVAVADGEVIGMVTLCVFTTLTGPKAYLDHLVVAPPERRRGVGRALAVHAIERARAAGASRIDLTAGDGKEAGRALYRSLGFRPRDTTSFRLSGR